MKLNYLIPAVLISAIAVDVSAQQQGKDKDVPKQKWRVQQLHKDNTKAPPGQSAPFRRRSSRLVCVYEHLPTPARW